MKLIEIYEAGAVRRYHCKRVTIDQTVSDHTWGVCLVLMWLYHPDLPSAKEFQQALLHDVPEVITGDVPAPAKWRSPELRAALATLEEKVAIELGLPVMEESPSLKFADNAELALHCMAMATIGNLNFLRTMKRGIDKMREVAPTLPTKDLQERAEWLILELATSYEELA